MTRFEKIVVGLAEQLIRARACIHREEFPTSVPCPRCVDRERKLHEALVEAVTHEGDRRFLLTLRRQRRYPVKKEVAA